MCDEKRFNIPPTSISWNITRKIFTYEERNSRVNFLLFYFHIRKKTYCYSVEIPGICVDERKSCFWNCLLYRKETFDLLDFFIHFFFVHFNGNNSFHYFRNKIFSFSKTCCIKMKFFQSESSTPYFYVNIKKDLRPN